MPARDLTGLRAMIFTRRSRDEQSDTSNDQQEELIRDYLARHQMICVDVYHSKGVSASVVENRSDIDFLFDKAERKEFDVLAIQSYDRLTRGGGRHGPYLLHKFAMLGVQVISVTNDIPDGDWAPLLEVVEFIKGNAYVKSLALNTTRGALAAILEGRTAYTRRVPFGIDRLMLSSTFDKLFRIRNLRDGTQVKLHADREEILERYPRNVKDEPFKHFVKRKEERIVLVNGDPDDVEVIEKMFKMHYVQGKGIKSITVWLNDKKIPTPTGKEKWNQCSVYAILRNPIYVQRGIANQLARGKFHNRASRAGQAPMPARKGSTSELYRPAEEWIIQRHNKVEIIPVELHEEIWRRQQIRLLRRAERDETERKKLVDRPTCRPNSHWPLLGSIFDRTTGLRLAGHRCGPERDHRYYMLQAHRTNPDSSMKWKRKFFPAPAAERAVFDVLSEVLGDVEQFRPMIADFVSERAKALLGDVSNLDHLRAERQKLVEKKACALDDFDDLGPELLRRKVAPLTAQIAALNVRIAEAEQRIGQHNEAPKIVEAVLQQLHEVVGLLGEPSTAALRSVLNAITRTVVDFENREAEIEVRLPEAATARPDSLKGLCATMGIARKPQHDTQPADALVLARFRCKRTTVKRHACLVCSRTAMAA